MVKKVGVLVKEFIGNDQLLSQLKCEDFLDIDNFMFDDLKKEFKKLGCDLRKIVCVLEFDSWLKMIGDLQNGMVLNGIIINVIVFGVFVNIGFKENGLIYKFNMVDYYVDDLGKYVILY